MDGGRVLLEMPAGSTWGNLQEVDSAKENYITVTGHPSRAAPRSYSIGNDFALVYLGEFGEGDTLKFTIQNVKAQTEIETTAFTILSSGKAGGDLKRVKGVERPDGDDADRLLGAVYHDSDNDSDDDGD